MSYKIEVKKVWRGKEVKLRGKRVIAKSVWEVGLVVEGQAKLLCPVQTGRLAASITTQMKGRGNTPRGRGAVALDVIRSPLSDNQAYVGTPVFYGPYIEFGTTRSAAQPFLRPALALSKGESLTIFMNNGRAEFKDFLNAA